MKKLKLLVFPALMTLSTFGVTSCGQESGEPLLPPVTDLGEGEKPEFVELSPIVAETSTLYPGQSIKLSGPENVTWSVSNDLATISADGTLKAGDKDGSFIVKATSKSNDTIAVQKLFNIYTMSSKDLANKLISWAEGYNYTMEWTGKFFNSDGSEVTAQQIVKDSEGIENSDASYIYEDMAIKGNLIKYTNDAFYWKYGVDGNNQTYEGGSYNSPLYGGSVWDYNIVDGKAVRGNPDYFDSYLGVGDYKKIYTADLTYFVRDEFKVEDSNLTLSEDKSALLYDATKDMNGFRDKDYYNSDYSLPITLWGIVDSAYALQFFDYSWDLDTTGKISYSDKGLKGVFMFNEIAIGTSKTYNYEMTVTISDIGSTIIDGIDELIAADKEEMSQSA